MRTRIVTLCVVAMLQVAATDPAPSPNSTGGASPDGFFAELSEDHDANSTPTKPAQPDNASTPAAKEGDASTFTYDGYVCVSTDTTTEGAPGVTTGTVRCSEAEEPEPAAITVGHVRRAFARLPLPASTLVIQPPDGLTLVNFDTNFFTTSTTPTTRQVTLLGRPVTIEATPSEYHWHFGDGDSLATTDPGAPYPDLTVTHNYLHKDTYAPRLDTVYSGRFRVGDGPWQAIPGTVTITGTPQQLRAIEAQPKLVAPYGR